MRELVLSLFPGIGLLDLAFEEAGFCVVRGPDLLWGGDVRRFHPPAGRFDGVIGGDPCQGFSRLAHMVRRRYGPERVAPNLLPEYERVVTETQARWFLRENVEDAPVPVIPGYAISTFVFDNRELGEEQQRVRRISFGLLGDRAVDLRAYIDVCALENPRWHPAVMASGGQGIKLDKNGRPKTSFRRVPRAEYLAETIRLQGLPADFFQHSPFTAKAQQHMIGNGVPLPMGRAIAAAVQRALDTLEVAA